MATDKRARKRAAREAAREGQQRELRRRRNIRAIAVALVGAVIVGVALFSGRGEPDSTDPAAGRGADDGQQEVACDGPAPPEANPQQYDSPPDLSLPENVDYSAVVSTSCGDIEMDLLEEEAPQTVANFVFLAREGFFDGLIWHRVEENAVIQTGDPNGENGVPPDGPGYTIPDELPERSDDYVYGVVGMANSGAPGSGGSQWFIVIHDREGGRSAGYPPNYSIFGRVEEDSYDVLDLIGSQPTMVGAERPTDAVKPEVPIYINSIEIFES